jgi:hypothetical protein
MINPNNYVIPIETLLKLNTNRLLDIINESKDCNETYIVIEPGIVLVERDNIRLNIVIGTGSIVLPRKECYSDLDEVEYVKPYKNEWINTCPVTSTQFLNVRKTGETNTLQAEDITLVSLTNKMIYPRVFSGIKVDKVLIPRTPEEKGIEWIMSDNGLRLPIVYLDEDNVVYVSQGSEELDKLRILLSYETRCNQYRLIASSS